MLSLIHIDVYKRQILNYDRLKLIEVRVVSYNFYKTFYYSSKTVSCDPTSRFGGVYYFRLKVLTQIQHLSSHL